MVFDGFCMFLYVFVLSQRAVFGFERPNVAGGPTAALPDDRHRWLRHGGAGRVYPTPEQMGA